jgi:DNA-directed RNA polymerase
LNLIYFALIFLFIKNYGPFLILFDSHKLAVLTLELIMSSVIRCGNSGVPLMKLMLELGNALESEYKVSILKGSKDNSLGWARKLLKASSAGNSLRTFVKIKRSLNDNEEWPAELKVKLGSVLLKSVLYSCKTERGESCFDCDMNYNFTTSRRLGVFKLNPALFSYFENMVAFTQPAFPPMLVPPLPWNSVKYYGAYWDLEAPLMKHTSRKQADAVRKSNMPRVLEGLNYLGSIPWKINTTMLNLVDEIREKGLVIGEMQPKDNMQGPTFDEYYQDVLKNPEKLRTRFFNPSLDNEEEFMKQAKMSYRGLYGRISKKNSEMHSLRCDLAIKLSVAKEYQNETFYFPHNVDFRGRAYPVPPNLNHLGSDLCRSLLKFADGKPLGKGGLRWLKIHIANLCGTNKISFADREKWVEDQMGDIYDSVDNPLTGKLWWTTSENPYQTLAVCMELVAALRSPDPAEFVSYLPVHQDGSCNGLQHYASLGRDFKGGKAVNLLDSQTPQDVYSSVLEVVRRKVNEDANMEIPEDDRNELAIRKLRANKVKDIVNRKVIKQTVMTSVYGVTFIGAKAQIQARLYEAFNIDSALLSTAEDTEIYGLATYLADITLQSLREVFQNAKRIMDWLADVSYKVAKEGHGMSWITPLGLPVLQPYRAQSGYTVRTVLSSVIVAKHVDDLPIHRVKQKSAFPPNFVHSLDATHMLLTSLRMKEAGLNFAAVHDSYWTHACDIDDMRHKLRESFVELYEQPILENLRDSVLMRYPNLDIPPLPARGDLDLKEVINSSYFFH